MGVKLSPVQRAGTEALHGLFLVLCIEVNFILWAKYCSVKPVSIHSNCHEDSYQSVKLLQVDSCVNEQNWSLDQVYSNVFEKLSAVRSI